MADIVINEISQNYSYVIGDSSYCCVALPITSCWGPAYTAPADNKDAIEDVVWQRFRANSQGLESFVSTYRGAAANYRLSQDYSYQMAVSLLTAGYDVLVCRLSPGSKASGFLHRSYVGQLESDWSPVGSDLGFGCTNPYQGLETTVRDVSAAMPIASAGPFIYTYKTTDTSGSEPAIILHEETLIEDTDFTLNRTTGEIVFLATSTKLPSQADVRTRTDAVAMLDYTQYSNSDVAKGILELPIKLNNTTSVSSSNPLPFYCNSDHPVIVTSTHPNFSTVTITSTVSSKDDITSDDKTGIYAIGSSGEISAIIFYLNPSNPEDRINSSVWAANGIVGGETYTVTGDKDLKDASSSKQLTLTAKYPGTFGNRLQCSLRRMTTAGINYWNLITYIVDTSGVRTAVENLNFVFDIENSTDTIPYVEEVQSQFVDISADKVNDEVVFADKVEDKLTIVFTSGADKANFTHPQDSLYNALTLAEIRYSTRAIPFNSPEYEEEFANAVKGSDAGHPAVYRLSHLKAQSATIACTYGSGSSWAALELGTDYKFNANTNSIEILSTSAVVPATNGQTLKVIYTATHYKSSINYVEALCEKFNNFEVVDDTTAATYEYLEWIFTNCIDLYKLLSDKLAYNPNRVISPGWDDQNFLRLSGDSSYTSNMTTPSPIHLQLMRTAYEARCATAYIDLPYSLAKQHVANDSQDATARGYAQLLARQDFADTDGLFTTHSALFGPWGTFMYVGTSKQSLASPSFLALLIQRSMILNQSLQYEWIQPSSRKNSVNIGKMQYTVSKKYLDIWQPDPDTEGGVGVNAIANIPDLGLSIWGDSTLYENPPATYQALRNLSTRLLVNAIKNVVYKVGISITFQYTNQTAFSSFYVGVTPILDSMKNSGAIGDYKVVIGNDFDAVGMVKANSCVGKIYITPNGTIQHITVDLIALPPQTDLSNYS